MKQAPLIDTEVWNWSDSPRHKAIRHICLDRRVSTLTTLISRAGKVHLTVDAVMFPSLLVTSRRGMSNSFLSAYALERWTLLIPSKELTKVAQRLILDYLSNPTTPLKKCIHDTLRRLRSTGERSKRQKGEPKDDV